MIQENKIKNEQIPYQARIRNSPILFTAPHSKTLKRGRPQQNIEDHTRQSFTSFLAIQFAKSSQNSFIVWKATKQINPNDLDPNYLPKQDFVKSPFHQSLHYWAQKNSHIPLLHIDIHGKENRQFNCEIDIGFRSLEVHWNKDPLAAQIRSFFAKNGKTFSEYEFGKFKLQFETDPILHGYWGGEVHTMNEQAILLGIPSLQLELPFDVRKRLFEDGVFRNRLRYLILQFYSEVIVPDFKRRKGKYKIEKNIANSFKPTVDFQKDHQKVLNEIIKYQLTNKQQNDS